MTTTFDRRCLKTTVAQGAATATLNRLTITNLGVLHNRTSEHIVTNIVSRTFVPRSFNR